jgi:hypothetical protein
MFYPNYLGGTMKKLFLCFSLLVIFGLSALTFAQTQVESGTWTAGTNTSGYTLDKNEGERSVLVEVTFDEPFDTKPDVVLGITTLDASSQMNVRYNVTTMSVSRDGFTIKITTWAETQIFYITGHWIAHATKSSDKGMD